MWGKEEQSVIIITPLAKRAPFFTPVLVVWGKGKLVSCQSLREMFRILVSGNLHQIKVSLIQVSNSVSSLFFLFLFCIVLLCFLKSDISRFVVFVCLFFIFVSLPFTFSLHCEKKDDNSHYNMEENKQNWFVLFTRKKVCTVLQHSCQLNSEEINIY